MIENQLNCMSCFASLQLSVKRLLSGFVFLIGVREEEEGEREPRSVVSIGQ